jgi:Flp pilus assembly pilin Flp
MRDHQSGQAIIEYLFIFALFAGVSLAVAKGVGNYSSNIFKGFAYALTQELSTGYCSTGCWHDAYENGVQ